MSAPKLIPIDKIIVSFYVRRSVNEDYVLHLAELYAANAPLPPLTVTEEWELVDGRHRLEALKLLDRRMAPCEIVSEPPTRAALIGMAFAANKTGPMPPTKRDVIHVCELLLSNDMAPVKVTELLGRTLPTRTARNYLRVAQGNIHNRKVLAAVEAVRTRHLPIEKASVTYGLKPEVLRTAVATYKHQTRRGELVDLKGALTTKYNSLATYTSGILKRLLEGMAAGEVLPTALEDYFAHWARLQARIDQQARDAFNRFNTATVITKHKEET